MTNPKKMTRNDKLRHDRLTFYKDDIEQIDKLLAEFLRLSGAKCALLIDKEGHLVTKRGELRTIDIDTISALVAGSFAATKEMARLLGEEEFTAMYHQGERDNIQLGLVGDRTLLTILFDDRTTVGMVRLYANETAKKLACAFWMVVASCVPRVVRARRFSLRCESARSKSLHAASCSSIAAPKSWRFSKKNRSPPRGRVEAINDGDLLWIESRKIAIRKSIEKRVSEVCAGGCGVSGESRITMRRSTSEIRRGSASPCCAHPLIPQP